MLITDALRETHRPNAKHVIFGFRVTSKRDINENPLQKFEPQTILSLLIGKRK